MADDRGPLKDTWTFRFKADALRAACEEQAASHRLHEEYWSEKYQAWDAEMRDTAKIEEQAITGGTQRVLRYDTGLQAKVTDASSRRNNHRAMAETYERWVMALKKAHPEEMLNLRIDDVTFFFPAKSPLPEGS
jgi:hypothetical protein